MTAGIPKSLKQAFHSAVYAFDNAQRGLGDRDPTIVSDDQRYANATIGEIAELAAAYDDPLPDDVYAYLQNLAPPTLSQFDKTYAAAAAVLQEMYRRLQASRPDHKKP